ncbi:MAG: hypothetical protein Crog4KO_16310 [Crocinitomicaceae bacterium]
MKFKFTLLSLLFSATGFSQNISTEAPSVSASAVTVPQGFLQAELSAGFGIDNDGTGTIIQSSEAPYLLLRYGWKDRLEFRLQNRTTFDRINNVNQYRYQQLAIGAKYAILPNDSKTNLALIVDISPYAGSWHAQQGVATLAFSSVLGNNSSIGANLGYSNFNSRFESGNAAFSAQSLLGSVVYSYSFFNRLTAFGEFFYSYSKSNFGNGVLILMGDSYGVDFGLQFLLREHIQLDWASGFSLTNKEQFHSLGFNIYFDTNKKK